MLLGNALLILGGVAGMVSARRMKQGVEVYDFKFYQGRSIVLYLEEGVCTEIPKTGSIKMLGSMECQVFRSPTCRVTPYFPKSKWRRGPNDNTDKDAGKWMDVSALNAGDRIMQGIMPPNAIVCRSFFDNLNEADSSANNVHTRNDGWHEPDEILAGVDGRLVGTG